VYYDRSRDPANLLNYVTYSQLIPGSGLSVSAQHYANWSPAFNGNHDGGQTTTSCGAFIGDYIGVISDNTHVYCAAGCAPQHRRRHRRRGDWRLPPGRPHDQQ